MMIPRYRELSGSDANAVRSLRLSVCQTDPETFSTTLEVERGVSVATFRNVLDSYRRSRHNLTLGAFDATLVGMIGAGRHAIEHSSMAKVRLWGLYVLRTHRGNGVGTKLLSSAIDFADSLDAIESIVLEVTEKSTAAIRLYERAGFEVVDSGRSTANSSETSIAELTMEYDIESRR